MDDLKSHEITKENYQSYLNLDIVAFSYDFGGAMGDGGGVIIATSDRRFYYTNYALQDFPHDLLFEIIPVLGGCCFDMFGTGSVVPEGWTYYSMGCGNNLVVRSDYQERFNAKKRRYFDSDLEARWVYYIDEILKYSQ